MHFQGNLKTVDMRMEPNIVRSPLLNDSIFVIFSKMLIHMTCHCVQNCCSTGLLFRRLSV
jgi:hypothetical protein